MVDGRMKKLLLLFSLLASFVTYGESICDAAIRYDPNYITVYLSDEELDLDYDELLTVCEEGDILNMSYFDRLRPGNSSVGRNIMSEMMASYCDLSETQVISNSILVCKLVDRDLN